MKDDIRKYLPDLATVLRETDPARIKAQRDKTLEDFERAQRAQRVQRKPVEEPAPVEVPEKAASSQAKETTAPARGRVSRRTIAVVIVVTLAAPLVIAAVFSRLTSEGKTGERAAASAAASAVAPAASSSSIQERPAVSAVPAASVTAPAAAPATSTSAKVEPRRQPSLKKKAGTAADAGTAGDQDPGLNE